MNGPSAGVTTRKNACDGFKFVKPRVYSIIPILTILIFAQYWHERADKHGQKCINLF